MLRLCCTPEDAPGALRPRARIFRRAQIRGERGAHLLVRQRRHVDEACKTQRGHARGDGHRREECGRLPVHDRGALPQVLRPLHGQQCDYVIDASEVQEEEEEEDETTRRPEGSTGATEGVCVSRVACESNKTNGRSLL